jgi:hypothetical protein
MAEIPSASLGGFSAVDLRFRLPPQFTGGNPGGVRWARVASRRWEAASLPEPIGRRDAAVRQTGVPVWESHPVLFPRRRMVETHPVREYARLDRGPPRSELRGEDAASGNRSTPTPPHCRACYTCRFNSATQRSCRFRQLETPKPHARS